MKKILFLGAWLAFWSSGYANTPVSVQATLLATLGADGQKISAIALEYESPLLVGEALSEQFQIETLLDNQPTGQRRIIRVYTNAEAAIATKASAGRFLILELDRQDKNADLYEIVVKNTEPRSFRARDTQGRETVIEKVQSNKVPVYYGNRLRYRIHQQGIIQLVSGKTVMPMEITTISPDIYMPDIEGFMPDSVQGEEEGNTLLYQRYIPKIADDKRYPLTIFLHGSGQLGTDNLAPLLSSQGAIATLHYEEGAVLVPQYPSVFDTFDQVNQGKKGGIHWQTENRLNLVLHMIDDTLSANPQIDSDRIYLIGLSRGAEGALKLLQMRPDFFAAALLMSGREANTIEWLDGQANEQSLAPIVHVPMWFFHSVQDKIAPVEGSRVNVALLRDLGAKYTKYTEFSFEKSGDNGIRSKNPHNTWEAVLASPEVMQWLLQQQRKHR